MGHPIEFPEDNRTFVGNSPEIGELPTYSDGERNISCWKLSWRERMYALFTGKVWLTVWGMQPPVNVHAEYPFETPQRNKATRRVLHDS